MAGTIRRQWHQAMMDTLYRHSNTYAAFAASIVRRRQTDLQAPPQHWGEVLRHPEREGFQLGAQAEINQLEAKGTYEVVDRPTNKQVIPLKWVFTYKTDAYGYLVRHKARICVRGDLQNNPGQDLYAATGAYRTFRILMALVAAFKLICDSADVTNAFLNAIMNEEVYVETPPGFTRCGKVWRLRKALYGLKELKCRIR